MILHLNGEPIRVLHVNRESGESTIVFRNHTMRLPTQHLVMIADSSPETLEELQELLRFSGVGFGSGDYSDSRRASVVSTVNDSDIFSEILSPLSVGDLSKPTEKPKD